MYVGSTAKRIYSTTLPLSAVVFKDVGSRDFEDCHRFQVYLLHYSMLKNFDKTF